MWQLLGIVFLVGLVLHYLWWIIGAAAVVLLAKWCVRVCRASDAAWETEQRRLEQLAGRADQQHQWAMSGDPRGVYGAEAMPTIHQYRQVVG